MLCMKDTSVRIHLTTYIYIIPGSKICYLGLVFGGLGAASKGRILEAAGMAVDRFGNAMQGHCKVNRIFCLLGDFVLLLISSFYVAGVGETRKETRKVWSYPR